MASKQMPKPGDLIEIFRSKAQISTYCHWAVYIGDGEVIHLVLPPESAGSKANSSKSVTDSVALVQRDKLSNVVGKDKWQINNLLDDKYPVREIADIIKEAREQVGKKVPCNIRSCNCEHFVTELRYGKAESRQVRNFETVVATGTATVLVLGAVALTGKLLGGSSREEEKN